MKFSVKNLIENQKFDLQFHLCDDNEKLFLITSKQGFEQRIINKKILMIKGKVRAAILNASEQWEKTIRDAELDHFLETCNPYTEEYYSKFFDEIKYLPMDYIKKIYKEIQLYIEDNIEKDIDYLKNEEKYKFYNDYYDEDDVPF